MAVVTNKRPLDLSHQIHRNIVDLTGLEDSDEERPAKRPRSESHTTPPLTIGEPPRSPAKDPDHGRNGRGTPRSPSSAIDMSIWQMVDGQQRSTASVNHAKLPKPPPSATKKAISSGIRELSLRPSPKPEKTTYRLTNGSASSTKIPEVINIDDDSDTSPQPPIVAHRAAQPKKGGSTSKVNTQPASAGNGFFPPELKPIRFDPEAPVQNGQSSRRSPTIQAKPAHPAPPARTLIVQVPARSPRSTAPMRTLPTVRSCSQQSQTSVMVIVPPPPAQQERQLKEMVRHLQNDPEYMRQNPDEVFAITGVQPFDDTKLGKKRYEQAAQKKKKKVRREELRLDLGPAAQPRSKPTEPLAFIHPRTQCRQVLNERFKDQQPPLTFENRRNERRLHGKFQFVSDYVISKKVRAQKQVLLQQRALHRIGKCGAYCATFGNEKRLKLPNGTNRDWPDGLKFLDDLQPYTHRPDGLVVLSDDFLGSLKQLNDRAIIFECGASCPSPQTCTDRVIQKGRTLPLQVFETQSCGFGVRTLQDVVRGQFIDLYLGEVLTTTELERREEAAEEDAPAYVMSLDVFVDSDHGNSKSMLHIDGQIFGAVTRYVNHSCEPNCKTLPVMPANGTKHLYHVAFFAIRDIPAGTELTIDYDPTLAGLTFEEGSMDANIVVCRCGSASCRKQLWRPRAEQRGRKRLLPSKDDD